MRMSKAVFSTAFVLAASVSACAIAADECVVPFIKPAAHCPLSIEQGKVKLKLTSAQSKASLDALRKVTDDHIDKHLDSGTITDVQVIGPASSSPAGQPRWTLKILHNYQGERESGNFVVMTPEIKDGGVVLAAGKKYRVYAVVIDEASDTSGDQYVWKGTALELP